MQDILLPFIIKDAVVPEPVNEMKLAKSIHYPNIKLKIYSKL